MDDVDTRRVTNAKVSTLKNEKTALVELLYPTLYKFTCNLGKILSFKNKSTRFL